MKRSILIVLLTLFSLCPAWAGGDNNSHYKLAHAPSYWGESASVTAVVMKNGTKMSNVELGVFSIGKNAECRGVGKFDSKNGLFFTMIYGSKTEPMEFHIWNKDTQSETIVDQNYTFSIDKIDGTPDSPYIIYYKSEESFIPGDVDGNGTVSIRDIAVLIDQLNHPSTINLERSDVDGNGVVNKGDVTALQHILLTK